MKHFYRTIEGNPNGLPDLYHKIVSNSKPNSHFVEVGCFKGAGAAAMCVEIINSGKPIKFDCVDIWEEDIRYQDFLRNLQPVTGYFNPIRLPRVEASALYADNSLDFVCIDASHDYEDVKADILSWLPKVKSGGILAGDDFYIEGVNRAVHEVFPEYRGEFYTWVYHKP